MVLNAKKKSKRHPLKSKYVAEKKRSEERRRMRKLAKKGTKLRFKRTDPGVPNSWPFKAEELEKISAAKAQSLQARKDAKLRKKGTAAAVAATPPVASTSSVI